MEQTRDLVVRILQRRGASTTADLATEIGVSPGSIRRHMDIMVAEGLLETELIRQERGRPVTEYTLSEAGEEETSGASYARLLDRIYEALASMTEGEISGLHGAELVDLIFDRIGIAMAREYSPRMTSNVFDRRIQQVTDVLHGEGILELIDQQDEVTFLRNTSCPARSCADANHAMCEADRKVIESLIGLPVLQSSTLATGGDACEYVVRRSAMAG